MIVIVIVVMIMIMIVLVLVMKIMMMWPGITAQLAVSIMRIVPQFPSFHHHDYNYDF